MVDSPGTPFPHPQAAINHRVALHAISVRRSHSQQVGRKFCLPGRRPHMPVLVSYYSRVSAASVESVQQFEAAIARKLSARSSSSGGGTPATVTALFAPSSPSRPQDLLSLLTSSTHLVLTCDESPSVPFLSDAAPPAALARQPGLVLPSTRACFTVLPPRAPALLKLQCDKQMM